MPRVMPGMLRFSTVAPVLVAVILSGSGTAGAVPVGLAVHGTVHRASAAISRSDCNKKRSSPWNVTGRNKVITTYDGRVYRYTVKFLQKGSCLTGRLADLYYPVEGSISGYVKGDKIVFTFDYPRGSIQGVRTYSGIIHRSRAVSGRWRQTGSQVPDHGSWRLADKVVTSKAD